jgi:hypothetical protein
MFNERPPEGKNPEQIAREQKIIKLTSGESAPPKGVLDVDLSPGQLRWLNAHAEETVRLPIGTRPDGTRQVIIPSDDDPRPQS